VLPPPPAFVSKSLATANQRGVEVFSLYVRSYAQQYAQQLPAAEQLPVSKLLFAQEPKSADAAAQASAPSSTSSPLLQHLRSTALSFVARSPFVALSGHDDQFTSAAELSSTVRPGIDVDVSGLSSTAVPTGCALNNYLLEWWKTEDVHSLVVSNNIRRGEVFFLMRDMFVVIVTIKAALEKLADAYPIPSERPVRWCVMEAFDKLAAKWKHKMEAIEWV